MRIGGRGRVETALVRQGDRDCVAVLRLALDPADWRLELAANRADFEHKLQSSHPGAVIIDVDRDDGERLLQVASTGTAVVTAITQNRSEEWMVHLFELGADSVYTKPLAPDLLRARLDAAVRLQRKLQPATQERYVFENLVVDLREPLVIVNGQQIHLSATEHKLIRILTENAGHILSHDQLLREVWGEEYEGNNDLLRTFVSSLRRHLREAGFAHELIHTERMLGYWVVRPPARHTEVQPRPVGKTAAWSTRLAARDQRENLRAGMARLQESVERLHEAASRRTAPDKATHQSGSPPDEEIGAL
jgi:two-component system KDP operon response regulator KdpE